MNPSATKAIYIGVRLLTIVATGLLWHVTYKYIYKKLRYDGEDESRNNEEYSDCYKVIRMKIPSYAKGGIIGKNGSTIKRIQDKTKTTIKFLSKNSPVVDNTEDKQSDWNFDVKDGVSQDSFDMILIRGLTLRVMEAEKEIKSIIASIPVYSEENMVADNRFVGKIIGKKGENIKRLKDSYNVQIDIDRNESPQRNINIRGTAENIAECRKDIVKMIDTLMRDGKSYPSVVPIPAARVSNPPMMPSTSTATVTGTEQKTVATSESLLKSEFVQYPGALNERVEVYVSSVVDCGRFHAHVAGEDYRALTALVDDMTDCFSAVGDGDAASQGLAVAVGDVVAGYHEASGTWQRVRVIEEAPGDAVEVLFLDYGDSGVFSRTAGLLRSFAGCEHFLALPFQALRLLTHGIGPLDGEWSEGAIARFEQLTKVGQCHPLAAVLRRRTAAGLEVQLLDELARVDVGRVLVEEGLAVSAAGL